MGERKSTARYCVERSVLPRPQALEVIQVGPGVVEATESNRISLRKLADICRRIYQVLTVDY